MTTPVDLPLLEALKGPSVSLLTRTRIKAAGTGEVYTGFSVLDHLNVALRVDDVSGDSGSSVTVLVEHSDDGDIWTTAATHTFTANATYRVVVDAPKDQLRAGWTVGSGLRDAVIGSVAVVPGFLAHGLDSLSESYADADSRQVVAADLELDPEAGDSSDTSFLAAVMGNLLGDALSKTKNYLAGLIGHYSVTGARSSTYPTGAVLAGIGDGSQDADGAVVAYIDGDSAETTAQAAFKVRSNNSTAGSGFDYGLDLQDAAHDGYLAVDQHRDDNSDFYKKAPVRYALNVCELIGVGAPSNGPTGTGAGVAGKGSRYTDTSTGTLYTQTGSISSPAWTASDGGSIRAATVVLDHDLIIDLVLTPVELVPAPGTGKLILGPASGVGGAIIETDTSAGAYTNLDAQAKWEFGLGGSSSATLYPNADDVLTFGAPNIHPLNMTQGERAGATDDSPGDVLNTPLVFYVNNGISGVLSGGAAGNTLIVTVYYWIADLS